MIPLENEFGWSAASISAAIAINIALFGLIGPFAASLMDRWGLKRVVLCALAVLAVAVALTSQMRAQWQLTLLWGIGVAAATEVTSMVLAVVVATRWFDRRRGVVLGFLTAANATGQLLFLCFVARLIEASGWRSASWTVASGAVAVFILVLLFMRNRPEDSGGNRMDGRHPRSIRRSRQVRWRRFRRCGWRRVRLHSGCWRAAFSSAAQVPTA